MGRPLMTARLDRADDRQIVVAVEGPGESGGLLDYTSPDPVWDAPPPNLDFVAIALVQYAASEGCDLHVEGPVSSELLDRLHEFQLIWAKWRPDKFGNTTVTAAEEVGPPELPQRAGAVMGFSGGVDAGFALAAHKTGTMGRLNRDIDLGVLVVGWDLAHDDHEAIARARAKAERALAAYDVELAVVSTNWQQEFCNAWLMAFNSGLSAILHTFSGQYSSIVHANDRSYDQELLVPPFGSQMAINHLLGTPWFPVVTTGGTHARIERLEFLRDHPALLGELRVCYQADAGGGNCGHCQKCVLTQLEWRAVGLPTAEAFPEPMRMEDLVEVVLPRPHVVPHFQDVLDRLPDDDEYKEPLRRRLEAHRVSKSPRLRRLVDRVAELEQEVASSREEVRAMEQSRSWRVTRPLRAASDKVARRRR
ncbi:hypothetical protein [Nocardioides caldifontis]|uniref:hypothetical protein n=1 Tax=Nocardioides caldifontis TaxID=2588938 RepID=UPI0011DF1CD9|nr:hypothetical protein [Nocardioides caldifontis]